MYIRGPGRPQRRRKRPGRRRSQQGTVVGPGSCTCSPVESDEVGFGLIAGRRSRSLGLSLVAHAVVQERVSTFAVERVVTVETENELVLEALTFSSRP